MAHKNTSKRTSNIEQLINAEFYKAFGKLPEAAQKEVIGSLVKSKATLWPMASDGFLTAEDSKRQKLNKPRAAYIDPLYNLVNYTGARVKPTSISFLTLRLMSIKCQQVRAIINTRKNQISQIEWDIRLENAHKKPSKSDNERIDYLKRLFNMPVARPNSKVSWRDFIMCLVEDRLVMDATAVEVIPNRRGLPMELYPVDGATIKPKMNEYRELDPEEAYIQDINGIVRAVFKPEELIYAIANPRTDIYSYGYGMSELETLIENVTSILFVDKYNRSYFSNNTIPDGVLWLAGEMGPEDLEMWKRAWLSEVKGIDNFWKLPIINIPDKNAMGFMPFKGSNREMQYNIYYDWLTRMACAVYQIDPAEINVHSQPGESGMFGTSTVAKVEYSKDKGMRALLSFYKDVFNSRIIKPIWPDLTWIWSGVEGEGKAEIIELRTKELSIGLKTVNEFREADHLEPVDWGDVPVNPTLLNYMMQKEQMNMMGSGGPGGQQGDEQQPGGDNELQANESEDHPKLTSVKSSAILAQDRFKKRQKEMSDTEKQHEKMGLAEQIKARKINIGEVVADIEKSTEKEIIIEIDTELDD